MNPWWLWLAGHCDLRKQVLVSFRLKDTIRVIESECYGQGAEPKDSVDQDGSSILKRVGKALSSEFSHLWQFESIGGLGSSQVISVGKPHKGFRSVTNARHYQCALS